MKCPRCQKLLKPIQYESVQIDSCPGNCGVWLDSGELQKLTKQVEQAFAPQDIAETFKKAAAGIPSLEKESREECPKCSVAMNPINYNYSSGVILDVCPSGHGIWFDSNELVHVQIHMAHWNGELKVNRSSWGDLARTAEGDAKASANIEAQRFESQLGPLARGVNAVFGFLKIKL